MEKDRWLHLRHLVEEALARPLSERDGFLIVAALDDPELLGAARNLLAKTERTTTFLTVPDGWPDLGVRQMTEGERLGPWRIIRPIATGGMGAVYQAERADGTFRKKVAIKVIKRGLDSGSILRRFTNERQLLASLRHPGICRLIDGGEDEKGSPYIVMEYVDGQRLDQYCDERCLDLRSRILLFLQVCEAVQYAHQNLLVHRDLKPSNILVTGDGLVQLLDFGIAKVLDPQRVDIDTLLTDPELRPMTPGYASPEQIMGQVVTTTTDVYALGVVLYELLAGRHPYRSNGLGASDVLRSVCETDALRPSATLTHREQSTTEIARLRSETARGLAATLKGDLDTIVMRAMHRDSTRRYASAEALGLDLSRYLSGQPIAARPDTWAYRTRKFVSRNRLGVLLATSLFLAATIAVPVIWELKVAAEDSAKSEREARQEVEVQRDQILRLADAQRLAKLEQEKENLWPAWPTLVPQMRSWLERAKHLGARLELHRATLNELRAEARVHADSADGVAWEFATTEAQWEHDRLAELDATLERFLDEDPKIGAIADVRARMAKAEAIGDEMIGAESLWEDCIGSIADTEECPMYGGLEIATQIGLVPLEPDLETGFWQFWIPATGVEPSIDASGCLVIDDDTAIVLLLVPGGTFTMGMASDPEHPISDVELQRVATPQHSVSLDPFLIGKYEVTQSQWLALTAENPSQFRAGLSSARGSFYSARHPVEQVNWFDATQVLHRVGLELPTEAQWEYACRGRTDTRFFSGSTVLSLQAYANIADAGSAPYYDPQWPHEPGLDDGFDASAPVGSFLPNAFGLFDTIGNVFEWTRDDFVGYERAIVDRSGLRSSDESSERVMRGGAYVFEAFQACSASRSWMTASTAADYCGLRAARAILP